MTSPHVNASLIVTGAFGITLGLRLVAFPIARVEVPPRVGTVRSTSAAEPTQPESLGASLAGKDPFRVSRRPAMVLYDPTRLAQPGAPRPPIPAIALVGIVWDTGRKPTALVEGIPGVDGPRPVEQGDTVGGLRVRRILRDRVVITGFDTTWTLTVREPWR
ncbi:MAG TPA: hypothetical protein VIW26_15645 [Gemmatimonadales bacterium]|jgi:hypothetical protein